MPGRLLQTSTALRNLWPDEYAALRDGAVNAHPEGLVDGMVVRRGTHALLAAGVVLICATWPAHGLTAHADRPRLRPRLFVTITPVNGISFSSLNSGWLAWALTTVSPGPLPHWRFVIHVFDLISHRLRVLHPPALHAEQYVSSIQVAPPWVA